MAGADEMVQQIKEALAESGQSQAAVSRACGHDSKWLGRVLRGAIKNPKQVDIDRLERVLNVDLSGAREPVYIRVPVINEGSASLRGGPVQRYALATTDEVASEQHTVAMDVISDSLGPTIQPGDTVFIDTSLAAETGDLVAVQLNNAVLLRWYHRLGNRHVVRAHDEEITIDLHQIEGVVTRFTRTLRPQTRD